jgi:hypothetical protein
LFLLFHNESGSWNQIGRGLFETAEFTLSIAVYKENRDWQKYRHIALCLRLANGNNPIIIYATGPKGEYVLEIEDNYNPTRSTRLAKEVRVGSLRTPMTKA